jgi:hypothetical protein
MPLGVPGGEIAPVKPVAGPPAPQRTPPNVTIRPIDPRVRASYENAPIAGNDPTSGIAYYLPGQNGALGGPATPQQRAGVQQSQRLNAALQASMNAQTLGIQGMNRQLGFDAAFGRIAFDNDMAASRLGADSDLARLNNARFRDVNLRAREADEILNATARALNTSNAFAGRRYGDTVFDATGNRDLTLARIRDAGMLAGRQYQQGNQFATADRDLALRRAALQATSARRVAADDAAARGAGTSTGLGAVRGEIQSQADIERLGAQNTFTRDTYGNRLRYDDAEAGNRRGIDEANFGFDSRLRSALTDRDSTWAQNANTYAEAQERNAREAEFIRSIANDYGVNENQIRESFRLGAERLGLDFGNLMGKIADAQNNNTQQGIAANFALAQQLLSASQGVPGRTAYVPRNVS